jgi:hypothetical protein
MRVRAPMRSMRIIAVSLGAACAPALATSLFDQKFMATEVVASGSGKAGASENAALREGSDEQGAVHLRGPNAIRSIEAAIIRRQP